MPKNKDFYLRIEILDGCLRNRYSKWTLKKLVDKVNEELLERYDKTTSKRTIQSDLQYLIEEKDAPIEKRKHGTETYFSYSDANFSIKNLPIRNEEIAFVKEAIDILRQVNDFKILKDVDEVITKLQSTVSLSSETVSTIIHFEGHTVSLGTEFIDDLYTAVKEKCTLKILYQSFAASQPKEYIFHPYLLKEYRNRWFVLGRIGTNNFLTNFALDRIKKIRNTNEKYVLNDLFDPITYFNNLIGVTLPELKKNEVIEIKVKKAQTPYIRTKPIHFTQEIIKQYKNGDMIIRLNLIINYELKSVLLGYGKEIEVIKPLGLRNAMRKEFDDAVSNYQKRRKSNK